MTTGYLPCGTVSRHSMRTADRPTAVARTSAGPGGTPAGDAVLDALPPGAAPAPFRPPGLTAPCRSTSSDTTTAMTSTTTPPTAISAVPRPLLVRGCGGPSGTR